MQAPIVGDRAGAGLVGYCVGEQLVDKALFLGIVVEDHIRELA